jgi:hypothetical protein
MGVVFAGNQRDWILKQLADHQLQLIMPGARIGKLHKVVFSQNSTSDNIKIRVKDKAIEVNTKLTADSSEVQEKLQLACNKALRSEALFFLPKRVESLAQEYGFKYQEVRVRKLVSRWGSCSKNRTITLSYYLVQLPWELVDYVLLHELVHTEHLHHGPDFWQAFKRVLPDAKSLQKQIRAYKPTIQAL